MKRQEHAVAVPGFSSERASLVSMWFDRWALSRVQQIVSTAPIRFVLWDGFELSPPSDHAVATIVFNNRPALFSWLWDPELNFGETYMSGAVEIRGDLLVLLESIYRGFGPTSRRPWWLWQPSNHQAAAQENVHHHYDLGNEFYRRWLDAEMVYTCAYFQAPDMTLEAAQTAKMDLVCRKLRLKPGERVIEAGCGWGALALFMARQYGVKVRAFNISKEQIAYARDRVAREGLGAQVEFIEGDYRDIGGTCDAFVSVGMLEHVGLPDFPSLGRTIDRCLSGTGRGLLHFIGRDQPALLNAWIRKRIFPGAYPPALREVFERVIEPTGFSVLDVENLRLHYARTLEEWRRRFDMDADEIANMFDQAFVRAWRLYLAGSHAAFTTGSLQLFQVLFARSGCNQVPWMRAS